MLEKNGSIDKLTRPPGPRGFASIPFMSAVSVNFITAFYEARKKYGDVFYYKFQGREWFVFSTATSAKHILKDNFKNYSKEIPKWLLGDIMGEGLVLTEGEKWKQQRKTVASTFHQKNITTLIPKVLSLTKEILEENKNIEGKNLSAVFNWLSMKVAASCFLGEELKPHEITQINELLPEYSDLAALKLKDPTRNIEWLPTPRNLRAKKIRKILLDITERITTSSSKQELSNHNIVTSIIKNSQLDKIKVSPKELQHQIFTFLAAGHETTSNLLNWTVLLLQKNPDCILNLKEELSTFNEDNISIESLSSLTYLEAIIKESLRLFPPVPSLARVAVEDDVIDGQFIPKGSVVPVFQYLIQRNEKYWTEPDSFKPERFLKDEEVYKKEYTPFSYIPFSAGPRRCIGEGFAYMEAKIILAHLFKNYTMTISNKNKVSSQAAVTLRPKPDLLGSIDSLN